MSNQSETKKSTTKLAACLNHLKHGGTAKRLFLPDENPEDFFALLTDAFEQYQPATDHDAALVTRCIHDHWILLRRERTADSFEVALHTRKPDPTYWVPVDLNEMHLLDRYKTEAARAYTRSLRNLQTIQKMTHDDQRWQHQLTKEKQKLTPPPTPPPPPAPPPTPAPDSPIEQTVYIGYEDGITTHYETTPTNHQLRPSILNSDQILRTYNFIGGVPPEYKHLLIGDNIYRNGSSTSVYQRLTAAAWKELADSES
jgi:hypothetical protein